MSIKLMMSVFQTHAKSVYGLCYYYVKNEQDADDIVMECFEAFIKKSQVADIKNARAWLLETARRKSLELIRKRIRDQKMQNEISFSNLMENDQNLHLYTDEQIELLSAGISALKEDQRNCIRHFFLAGKSYAEVSQLLDLDIKKVKSAIQNGKRNLKIYINSRTKINP